MYEQLSVALTVTTGALALSGAQAQVRGASHQLCSPLLELELLLRLPLRRSMDDGLAYELIYGFKAL